MRTSLALLVALFGCKHDAKPAAGPPTREAPTAAGSAAGTAATPTLASARRGFATHIVSAGAPAGRPDAPPRGVFELVRYASPAGALAAYVTPDPRDGARHPAIVWITGGDCNSIGDVWTEAPASNDQTAAAYRRAGVVMMVPSLRGGNDNPGRREGFYGEVDDVLAAADHLAALPYVDPARVYLGGHSTGATVAMLTAEMSGRFRAVLAFGPTDDPSGYGDQFTFYDPSRPRELALRSPGRWLDSVTSPLFVFEGVDEPSNIDSLRGMKAASHNRMIHFVEVPGADHFSILAPAGDVLAAKILRDTGPASAITLTDADVAAITAHVASDE